MIVAAAVAEPKLLQNGETARVALELHKKIFKKTLSTKDCKTNNFRILRKGFEYTLSLVICAIPKEGFKLLNELVDFQHSDLLWIIKENLKKNRLVKAFSEEVKSAKSMLFTCV